MDNKRMDMGKSREGLPEDIMFEIFLRLRVKTLVRLSCVCKSWRSLIRSNQLFIRSHLNQETHVEVLMYSDIDYRAPYEVCHQGFDHGVVKSRKSTQSPKPFYLGRNIRVVGCCDGLVCYYTMMPDAICLWNPALHQCRAIPNSGKYDLLYFVGFGYDPQNQDYKIVNVHMAKLYSLRCNSWKSIANDSSFIESQGLRCYGAPLNFKNRIHWIGAIPSCEWDNREPDSAVTVFDIVDEKLYSFKTPSSLSTTKVHYRVLWVLNGCLSLIVTSTWTEWEVWSMKAYGMSSSWTRAVVIHSDIIYPRHPIGFSAANGTILLFEEKTHIIFSYNTESSGCSSNLFYLTGGPFSSFDHYFVADYVESLISPMTFPSSEPSPSERPPSKPHPASDPVPLSEPSFSRPPSEPAPSGSTQLEALPMENDRDELLRHLLVLLIVLSIEISSMRPTLEPYSCPSKPFPSKKDEYKLCRYFLLIFVTCFILFSFLWFLTNYYII